MVGESGLKTREEGLSRFFSGYSRKPWVPSTYARDLRELFRVPLRSQGYCAVGRGRSELHWVWCSRRGPYTFIKRFFSSSSLSAIRVVSSASLRGLIFLPAILIPAWVSPGPVRKKICQSRFDARYWMLGSGALGRPRGMEWGGRREEGSGWARGFSRVVEFSRQGSWSGLPFRPPGDLPNPVFQCHSPKSSHPLPLSQSP